MLHTHETSDTQSQERPSPALTQESLYLNPITEYPGGYRSIPIATGITFSTANFAQALLIQYIYPGLRIRTPFTMNEFSSFWARNEIIRRKAYELRNHLYYSEASREPIASILSSIYQHITSLQSPTPIAQPITPEEKAIAARLLKIYFETMKLTIADISHVINESGIDIHALDEEHIKLILKEKISLEGHKSPICLQVVLPYSNMFLDAVDLCQEQASWKIYFINTLKKLWHSLGNFFTALLNRPATNFLPANVQNQNIPESWKAGAQSCPDPKAVPLIYYNSPFSTPKPIANCPPKPTQNAVLKHVNHKNHDNDDDNDNDNERIVAQPPATIATISIPQHLRSLQMYKKAISKTLDQYICEYKISAFAHHHDNRARAVKNAIEQSTSFENIYIILKRQEVLFGHERKRLTGMSSQDLQKYARIPENMIWRNLSERQRWNGFFDVVHYTDPDQSGYYQAIQEALAIVPYDASLPLRYGIT